jgi:hypothetical protein
LTRFRPRRAALDAIAKTKAARACADELRGLAAFVAECARIAVVALAVSCVCHVLCSRFPFADAFDLVTRRAVVNRCFADGSKRILMPVLKRLGHGLAMVGQRLGGFEMSRKCLITPEIVEGLAL